MSHETDTAEAIASTMRAIEAAFLLDAQGATLAGATEIWLVRHGDCYDGTAVEDPPLSQRGRDQARRLAERLNHLGYAAVYASPLRRALETARAITPDVRVDDRLVEADIEFTDGQLRPIESTERVLERMRGAVDDLVAAHAGGRVVVVGHGIAIMAYLCDLLRLEWSQLRLLPFYTSVCQLRVLGDRRMVGCLVDTAHLEAS